MTLNPWIKWIAHTLTPGFVTGSALLAAGVGPETFAFWWGVSGAVVGGVAGKAFTVMGDNTVQRKNREHPDEG